MLNQQRGGAGSRTGERKRTKAIFELLPVGISILDAERRVVFANSALVDIMGLSNEGCRPVNTGAGSISDPTGHPCRQRSTPAPRRFAPNERCSMSKPGWCAPMAVWLGPRSARRRLPCPAGRWFWSCATSPRKGRRRRR
ncbi:MAG: PAS domain-containing protein [Anaerolineae bacterium]|nr:PAS domain-containing protein [Anaerolineae bacterium]